jgi:hypothetical protein
LVQNTLDFNFEMLCIGHNLRGARLVYIDYGFMRGFPKNYHYGCENGYGKEGQNNNVLENPRSSPWHFR